MIIKSNGERVWVLEEMARSNGEIDLSATGAYGSRVYNLEIKPTRKVEFWVNRYADGALGSACRSLDIANDLASSTRTECLRIVREYEEGEGLWPLRTY